MSAWYAERLRTEAGRIEAEIERLEYQRHHWQQLRENAADTDGVLYDTANEMCDKLADQIGALEIERDNLDDEIASEDPEMH